MTQKAQILVMGAGGRLGAALRAYWPDGRAVWQSRQDVSGGLRLDPLADPDALARAAKGCSVVLCLAGAVPGRSDTMADNGALALAAVRAAARAGAAGGAAVWLASSAAVYGRAPGLWAESQTLAPVAEYGRAKAAMERAAAELGARLGVAVTALRIGNVAGSDAALGGWKPGFRLDRFADGRTPARSYIGPETLAQTLLTLADAGPLPGALNIAAPGAVEMGALLDAAGLEWAPRPPGADAIAEACLDLTALSRLAPLDPAAGTPERLVAEWRDLKARQQ